MVFPQSFDDFEDYDGFSSKNLTGSVKLVAKPAACAYIYDKIYTYALGTAGDSGAPLYMGNQKDKWMWASGFTVAGHFAQKPIAELFGATPAK